MMNWFSTDPCDCAPALPVLCEDPLRLVKPKFSQICGLIMLPLGAARPVSWTDYNSFAAILDNTATDISKGKWFTGQGELPEATDITVSIGRGVRRIVRRRYDLPLNIDIATDQQYEFIRSLQKNYRSFRFWIPTLGGRLLGGNEGIRPDFLTAKTVYGGGVNDVETGRISLQWFSDVDPERTYMPDLFLGQPSVPSGGESGGGSTVNVYSQNFEASATATLTWTQNGGDLPLSNTEAQILVFQNGQKLYEHLGQYTINHSSGPGESEIVIGGATHFSGANYQAIVIEII